MKQNKHEDADMECLKSVRRVILMNCMRTEQAKIKWICLNESRRFAKVQYGCMETACLTSRVFGFEVVLAGRSSDTNELSCLQH